MSLACRDSTTGVLSSLHSDLLGLVTDITEYQNRLRRRNKEVKITINIRYGSGSRSLFLHGSADQGLIVFFRNDGACNGKCLGSDLQAKE